MEFAYKPEEEAFRAEIKKFIDENVTPEIIAEQSGEGRRGEERAMPLTAALREKMADRGWIGLAVPEEYGGHGGDLTMQYVMDEEFSKIGVSTAGNFGGSTYGSIMRHGTDEQKNYFLPRMLSGEISFGLGYTEPSGGADLASLQTRAVRDGDDWVINGQKMYGGSPGNTHFYLLARTDPNVEKHRGISVFLVPMDTPGVTFRPLRMMKSRAHRFAYGSPYHGETFFEDVRVPATALLGEENNGWFLARTGLYIDRIGISRFRLATLRTDHIIDYVKDNDFDGYSPREDPVIRDRLAELWIERQMYRLMTMRSLQMVKRDMPILHESPAEKVWGPEHNVKAIETIAQILGPYMQLEHGEEAPLEGEFGDHIMSAWVIPVNHGSVHIMRDQIARRPLGLPRG